ncbi:MarR family winged helix-turn-helix transcriptional regulator [Microbulbifer sp. ANSA003]|uniref:MarR family winged helix-turn-helix transcriptional regulator n=1 Tax=Microbulbifer sp. ANSA003 TaxID=3243360 RepID=UPI004042C80D
MEKHRSIHEAIFRLSYDLGMQIAPQLEEMRIKLAPQQLRAMRQIWAQQELTPAELGGALKRDKGQITRLVDELCTSGMVERVPNPSDGRSKLLRLTGKGNQFFARVEEVEGNFSKDLMQGIDKKNLQAFFAVADQLSRNLTKID